MSVEKGERLSPNDSPASSDHPSKLVTTIVSTFTANYVHSWSSHFPDTPLTFPLPTFDGRAVCYPTIQNLRDYLSWRQADCKHPATAPALLCMPAHTYRPHKQPVQHGLLVPHPAWRRGQQASRKDVGGGQTPIHTQLPDCKLTLSGHPCCRQKRDSLLQVRHQLQPRAGNVQEGQRDIPGCKYPFTSPVDDIANLPSMSSLTPLTTARPRKSTRWPSQCSSPRHKTKTTASAGPRRASSSTTSTSSRTTSGTGGRGSCPTSQARYQRRHRANIEFLFCIPVAGSSRIPLSIIWVSNTALFYISMQLRPCKCFSRVRRITRPSSVASPPFSPCVCASPRRRPICSSCSQPWQPWPQP